MSAESSGRCWNTIRLLRSRIANAGDGDTRTSVASAAPAAFEEVTTVLGLLLLKAVRRGMRQGSHRTFFGAHGHRRYVERGPLLKHFSLCEVFLFREACLSFARGIYAQGGGGVEHDIGVDEASQYSLKISC